MSKFVIHMRLLKLRVRLLFQSACYSPPLGKLCKLGMCLTQVAPICSMREWKTILRNLTEFDARLGTEEACREYLFQLRWPAGFRCPRCEGRKSWPVREVLLQCAACGYQTSVTAGTIFQDTRTPLRLWFHTMWWITTQKNGASALGLQRVVGPEAIPNGLDLAAQIA